jgi:hypothetical protein
VVNADTSNRRFGVATAAPTATFHIKALAGNVAMLVEAVASSNNLLKLSTSGSHAVFNLYDSAGNADVQLHAGGDSYFNGGNVGIGDSTPSNLLDIGFTNNSTYSAATIFNFGGIRIFNASTTNNTTAILNFAMRSSSTAHAAIAGITPSANNSDLAFLTEISNVITETMRLQGNKLGIGTAAPSTRLDIDAGAMEFAEMTAPAAGAANTARLFARDDGGGDTELCVRFNTGDIQVISPLEFGEISVIDNVSTTTITTMSVAVQFLFFDTNGSSNGATPDHTNDHITINKTGEYLIDCSLTATSVIGSGGRFAFEIQKNNGASLVGALHAHRQLSGGGGDTGSISLSGLAPLSTGDTIELWVQNDISTQNIIIEDATLSLTMIGA